MSNFRKRWEEGVSKDKWTDSFDCWNADEPLEPLREDRYCGVCGANKPLENHELWCPHEPDRIAKDDPDFWLDDDERCDCTNCTTSDKRLDPAYDEWADNDKKYDQDEHSAHVDRILDDFSFELRAKYEAGQKEHGGKLWEKPGMLNHAIEEVLDLVVYLYTLREQQENKDGKD